MEMVFPSWALPCWYHMTSHALVTTTTATTTIMESTKFVLSISFCHLTDWLFITNHLLFVLTLKSVRNSLYCNVLQCHSHGHMGDSCHGHGGGHSHSHGHGGPGFGGFMPGNFHGQLSPGPLDSTQQPRKFSHPEDSSSWDIVKATQ